MTTIYFQNRLYENEILFWNLILTFDLPLALATPQDAVAPVMDHRHHHRPDEHALSVRKRETQNVYMTTYLYNTCYKQTL